MVLPPSLTLQVIQHDFRWFVAVSHLWRRQGPEHALLAYSQGSLDHRTDCPLRKHGCGACKAAASCIGLFHFNICGQRPRRSMPA